MRQRKTRGNGLKERKDRRLNSERWDKPVMHTWPSLRQHKLPPNREGRDLKLSAERARTGTSTSLCRVPLSPPPAV